MSNTGFIIILIALVVVAMAVYFVVMGGGIKLTRRELKENPVLLDNVDDEAIEEGLPPGIDY